MTGTLVDGTSFRAQRIFNQRTVDVAGRLGRNEVEPVPAGALVGCVRNQGKGVSDFSTVDQAGVFSGEVEIRDAITSVCRCFKGACGVGDLATIELAAEGCRAEDEEGSTGAGVDGASNRARSMINEGAVDNALVRGSVEGEVGGAGALSCTAVEGAGMIDGRAVNRVNHTGKSRIVELIVGLAHALVDCTSY